MSLSVKTKALFSPGNNVWNYFTRTSSWLQEQVAEDILVGAEARPGGLFCA